MNKHTVTVKESIHPDKIKKVFKVLNDYFESPPQHITHKDNKFLNIYELPNSVKDLYKSISGVVVIESHLLEPVDGSDLWKINLDVEVKGERNDRRESESD